MVDRINEIKKNAYAVGIKTVSLSEDCFEHHFPGQPIYPGALLLESMAQLGGALIEISLSDVYKICPRCVLSVAKAKFRDFARPGDRLVLRAQIDSRHEESFKVKVSTECESKPICEADLIFVLIHVDDPILDASRRQVIDLLTKNTRYIK